MAEIIKIYSEPISAVRFIGKKYGDKDRVDGAFGVYWGQWFEEGLFDTLEALGTPEGWNAGYIGLMRAPNGEFEYWIGVFTPAGSQIPEGYDFIDFDAGKLGVCHVYGKEHEVFMHEGECCDRLKAEGFEVVEDACFECYVCPRFTTPDEKGNIILDVCFWVK